MDIEKNDIVELNITDLSETGEGIGKAEGYTLFIKDTVPGDRVRAKVVKAKERYGYARLIELLVPSPERVEPRCPVADPCGGCQLQAMSYEAQLAFKEKKVRGQLERIGGFSEPPVLPIIGAEHPYGYRNKAQFPVGRSRDGRIITGFYAGRTHSIIETPRCYLGSPVNEEILRIVIGWMEDFGVEPYDEMRHAGLVRHVLIRTGETAAKKAAEKAVEKEERGTTLPVEIASGGAISEEVLPGGTASEADSPRQVMVCLVINGKKLPHAAELTERLRMVDGMASISYNINMERTNVILGREMRHLYGDGYIRERIGELRYRISPQSFFQVNREQTERLYSTALEFAGLTGQERVWDLYCGTGTITLFLARQAAEVCGVEVVPAAIEDAWANAAANGIANARFFVGRAEEVLPRVFAEEGACADVIVLDPPRHGCDRAVLDTILAMEPERVVYVSCGPATLARDLKILCAEKYRLEKVQPVDMFAETVGVEVVCLLSKLRAN